MRKILATSVLAFSLIATPVFASQFSGGNAEDIPLCSNYKEVEVPVYVEVPEYIEVEVPVYLPSEENSEVIWDGSAKRLYVYNVQVWEGPVDTGATISYGAFEYEGDRNFKLVEIEE